MTWLNTSDPSLFTKPWDEPNTGSIGVGCVASLMNKRTKTYNNDDEF